ncbi:hypothetical protein ABVT39_006068 [Epinephelus coioides]
MQLHSYSVEQHDDMLSEVSRASASWSRTPSLSLLTITTRKRSFQHGAPRPERVTRAGVDHTHTLDVLEPAGRLQEPTLSFITALQENKRADKRENLLVQFIEQKWD